MVSVGVGWCQLASVDVIACQDFVDRPDYTRAWRGLQLINSQGVDEQCSCIAAGVGQNGPPMSLKERVHDLPALCQHG
ncbi:hypothetical protein D8B34_19080 [Verminephrobacter eiseniae]|nr:hypothetical protein [Verminephrobacter eiseniae]MCW8187635.1 hypothetical protein [Verminephrobacter eiseniae]MCW8225522.1 hypothetical protein [Verminephrobacter eiseniae]MCW8235779.1 hypothetical protein [Verminephrobacter eiseniae]